MGDDVFETWAKENVAPTKDSPKAGLETVSVTMTIEEAARRWLRDNNFCLVNWKDMEGITAVYRKHGKQDIVFNADKSMYYLRPKGGKDVKRNCRPGRS